MKLPPAAADTILLYSLFKKSDEGKPTCDFTNQKVWILIWATLNILAVVGLLVALGNDYYHLHLVDGCLYLGWYSWLGFWAMLHEPVHFVVFLLLVATIPTEIYTLATVFVLYAYLKEAYIDVDIAILVLKLS